MDTVKMTRFAAVADVWPSHGLSDQAWIQVSEFW